MFFIFSVNCHICHHIFVWYRFPSYKWECVNLFEPFVWLPCVVRVTVSLVLLAVVHPSGKLTSSGCLFIFRSHIFSLPPHNFHFFVISPLFSGSVLYHWFELPQHHFRSFRCLPLEIYLGCWVMSLCLPHASHLLLGVISQDRARLAARAMISFPSSTCAR